MTTDTAISGDAPRRKRRVAAVAISLAVAVVITAAGVGFFMPLLGLSLLAFLGVDVVVGAVQQRRAEMR